MKRTRPPSGGSSSRRARAWTGLLLAAGLAAPLGAQEAQVAPGARGPQEPEAVPIRLCLSCHADDSATMEFADGVEVPLHVDKPTYLESAHGRLECVACHEGLDPMEHMDAERGARRDYRIALAGRCRACHDAERSMGPPLAPASTIEETLHSTAVEGTPLCSDCHPAHSMRPAGAPRASISRTCAGCHEGPYSDFAASAHGAGLQDASNADVPVCTDCHPGHREEGTDATSRQVRMGRPCIGCHQDERLMEPYGLSTSVVSTYLSDFHGVSVKFYDEEQAADLKRYPLVCADCHGVHDVRRVSDQDPDAMRASLLGVCQRCHEEAPASFPAAWLSHYEPSLTSAPLVYLVKVVYWVFIPFVIVGLVAQIFMHLVLFPLRKRRARRSGRVEAARDARAREVAAAAGPARFVRFDRRTRVEHLIVMISFVLLLVTGLPQKFHDAGWASGLVALLGGIDLVRVIHRLTGIVFAAVAVSHLALAVWGVLRQGKPASMVPTRKDFRDAIQNMRWYLGRSDREPEFERYDYRQKFEYWGLILGGTIMVASGFILYFPLFFAQFLPGQVIAAAKAAHSYEAMMALLTIVVWHMYGVHLNPDTFPLDTTIFSGTISRERMLHEHPLEYERLLRRRAGATEPGTQPHTAALPAIPP